MPRLLSLFIATIGIITMLFAGLGYLPLRDFMFNGTPTFNPGGHLVLGPLSFGLDAALANSTTATTVDAASYCVALQYRLIGLALVGLTLLIIGIAGVRATAVVDPEDGTT